MQLKLRLFVWGFLGLFATNAFTADFDWNGGTGDWDDAAQWSGSPVAADFDGTNGTTFAASTGTLQADNSPATTSFDTFGAELTITGNGDINSYSGATLLVTRTAVNTAPNAAIFSDLHLNGGRLNFNSANNDTTYDGNISVDANSVLISSKSNHWKGTISGSGNLTYSGGNAIRFFEIESAAANSFAGDWDITTGGLRNDVAGGLGTGAVTVRNGATLSVFGSIDSTSSITMNNGSTLEFHSTGTYDVGNVILEGTNINRLSANNSEVTVQNGNLAVNGDSSIGNARASRYLRFNSTISGSSSLTIDNNNGFIDINADNEVSGFTGDWRVNDGLLRLLNNKALGVTGLGELTIDQSTNADALVEYLGGTNDVTVAGLTFIDGGGTVEVEGSFTGITYDISSATFGGRNFSDFFNGTGTITVLAEAIPSAAIPEPGSFSLLGLGLLALLRRRRRNN